MTELTLLEPFSIVKYMFGEAGVSVDYDAVKKFWSHHKAMGSPWALNSTATDEHIPLGLHGDGAKVRQLAYQPAQKIVGIWLNAPLWRPKSVRASRWLIAAIKEEDLYQHYTLDCLYKRITWSLNCLHSGVFPSTGPNGETLEGKKLARAGTPICDGKVFAVTEVRADWVYHKQVLRFQSSWKGGARVPVCFFALRGTLGRTNIMMSVNPLCCGRNNIHWLTSWCTSCPKIIHVTEMASSVYCFDFLGR